jgi:hypothetical protein
MFRSKVKDTVVTSRSRRQWTGKHACLREQLTDWSSQALSSFIVIKFPKRVVSSTDRFVASVPHTVVRSFAVVRSSEQHGN